jgi:hypothetical protein
MTIVQTDDLINPVKEGDPIKDRQHPPDAQGTVPGNILIIGQTGSGKSYFLEEHVMIHLRKQQTNVIMLDVKDQHDLGPGEIKLETKDISKLDSFRFRRLKRFKIRIIPSRGLDMRGREDIFSTVCRFVSKKGNCYFIIEEFAWLVKNKWVTITDFDDLLRLDTGDHNRGVYVIIVTQYGGDTPSGVFGACHYKYIFRQNKKQILLMHSSGHIMHKYEFLETKSVYPAGYVGQYYSEE